MRKTTSMILAALFAALTAVGALIRIPTPVSSFTLQVLFTAMAGILLGKKWGAASQAVYVLLGLTGLPIFTSGGGPGAFLQPSGGFLVFLVYSRKILCFRQVSIMSFGQTAAWTSPMWAQRSMSIHNRLWPMPPPMV